MIETVIDKKGNAPLWQLDRFTSEYENIAGGVRLVSCDIFDTLLLRTVDHPADVFVSVGEELLKHKRFTHEIDPKSFKEIRIQAEKKARNVKKEQFGTREVTLLDIYEQVPFLVGDIAEAVQIELAQEMKHVYLNPVIHSLLEEACRHGKRIVLLSDMYLSSRQIKELLQNSGFNYSMIDDLIMSSEQGTSKSEKLLFQKLLDRYSELQPSQIVHIGDNAVSDIRNAKLFGIHTLHYDTGNEIGTIYERERFRQGVPVPELLSLRKMVGSLSSGNAGEEGRFWFEFGACILGPFLSIYTEWIIDQANKQNIKHIYPLMREAGIMQKLLQRSVDRKGLTDWQIKPMYISRKAAFLPSQGELNASTIIEIFNKESNLTIDGLFARYQRIHPFEEYGKMKFSQSGLVELARGRTLKDEVIFYLTNEDTLRHINEKIIDSRMLMTAYLQQEFDLSESFMTVDIGYSGSIARALDIVLSEMDRPIYHSLALSSKNAIANILAGTRILSFVNPTAVDCDYMLSRSWTPALIEILLMDDVGSTLRYDRTADSCVFPVLEEVDGNKTNKHEKQWVHQGIMEFQSHFFALMEQKPDLLSQIVGERQKLQWLLTRFMDFPTMEEALKLGSLFFENEYVDGNQLSPLITEEQIQEVRKIGTFQYVKKSRKSFREWPSGLAEITMPNYSLIQLFKEATNDQQRMIASLNEFIYKEKISQLIVYGGGEIGCQLVRLLTSSGIHVCAIVDSNSKLWGTHVEGVKVISSQEALQLDTETIVIASYAYMKEIRQQLEQLSRATERSIRIIDYAMITE